MLCLSVHIYEKGKVTRYLSDTWSICRI